MHRSIFSRRTMAALTLIAFAGGAAQAAQNAIATQKPVPARPAKSGQLVPRTAGAGNEKRTVDRSRVVRLPGSRQTEGGGSFRPVDGKAEFDQNGNSHAGPHVTDLQTGQIHDFSTYAEAVAAADSLNEIRENQLKRDTRQQKRDERKGNNDNTSRGGNTPNGKNGVDPEPTP